MAIIDVATSTFLSQVFLIQNIRGIAVSPDGSKVYVAHFGGGSGGTTVYVLDAQTLATITTITVDSRPHAIAISGTRAYVTHRTMGGSVSVIDITTDSLVTTVSPFEMPAGIVVTPNGQTVYVATSTNNRVTPIDTTTLTPGTPIDIGVNTYPQGIAVSPNGQWLYVANSVSETLSIIDVTTNDVNTLPLVNVTPSGVGFTPDGLHAFVLGWPGASSVPVITVATQTVDSTLSAGLGTDYGALGNFIGPPLIVPDGSSPELSILSDTDLDAHRFGRFVPFHGGTLRLDGNWGTTRNISMLSAGTINVNASQSVISGLIAGEGQLNVTGLGDHAARLTLTGTATHAGGTRVESATLKIDGTHVSDITVAGGGYLEGTGSVQNVTVEAIGFVRPALAAPGTLTAANVTFCQTLTTSSGYPRRIRRCWTSRAPRPSPAPTSRSRRAGPSPTTRHTSF